MLSKNTRLAELRLFPFVSINRLQTPTKLVLNCAFQIATNKNLSGWKLLCRLTAACASGTQGLAARHLAWRRKCPNMMICAHRRLYPVSVWARSPHMGTSIWSYFPCPVDGSSHTWTSIYARPAHLAYTILTSRKKNGVFSLSRSHFRAHAPALPCSYLSW